MDVGENQVAIGAIEARAIWVSQAVSIDFGHLARCLEWIVRWDAVLTVGANRINVWRQGWMKRIEAQHFAQWRGQILGVATRLNVAGPDIIGVAAIA